MVFKTEYTEIQKQEAANYYAVYGNASKVSKKTTIPVRTVRYWTTTNWWTPMVEEARKHHQDKMDGRFTAIIARMAEKLMDRVENGDICVDPKTMTAYRKGMAGKDLMQALALLVDRRAIMRGEPSRINKTSNIDTHIQNIQKKMEAHAKEKDKGKEKVKELNIAEYVRPGISVTDDGVMIDTIGE